LNCVIERWIAVKSKQVAVKREARRQGTLAMATACRRPGMISRLRIWRGMIAAVMIFRPAARLVLVETERQTCRRRMEPDQQRKQKRRDGPLCGGRLAVRGICCGQQAPSV